MADIIVIDDEIALAELFSAQLSFAGHNVKEFSQSIKAIEYLRNLADLAKADSGQKNAIPDIVITDVRMPKVSGLEICKLVRKNFPTTQLIVISGFAEDQSEFDTLQIEARLKKPFQLEDLVKTVERLALAKQTTAA